MKKTYIAPQTRAFKVSTQCVMVTVSQPIGEGTVDGDQALGKEEKSSNSGIWDLYN